MKSLFAVLVGGAMLMRNLQSNSEFQLFESFAEHSYSDSGFDLDGMLDATDVGEDDARASFLCPAASRST